MWPLRNVKHFCDTDVEWHAIVMGLCFPLWLWPFIIWKDRSCAFDIWRTEPWYCGAGMLLRVIGFAVVLL